MTETLKKLNVSDYGVALYILAAVMFMIVPIPSWLLDIMLAFNISVALVVMMNCLFVKEPLDMSFYPTLLLFTTIFRISLNVSSTRLILSTGQPGNVVESFGQFMGGGDLIIGAIVYVILIIIQFVVINKGTERISEVTARFTLDAMPGKQMAIDADLNTGAITDEQARERRNKLQEESAFFGSMDGATKYGETKGGHLKDAVFIPYDGLFRKNGTLKSDADIVKMFSSKGIKKGDCIVTYCTGGIRSAYMELVLEKLGYKCAANYAESFWRWNVAYPDMVE